MSIYKEIIKAKDDSLIPVFNNNKTMHSKYSPLREAESFGEDIKDSTSFIVILGLGGGYHIESFMKRHKDSFIIVIENSVEDINFLNQIPCVKKLSNSKSVKIIDSYSISETLKNFYLPAVYGGINIISNRAWYESNPDIAENIITQINQTIKEISRDYSVQCHFGQIWQKNIISNLKICSTLNSSTFKIDTAKTAAIIAAGPTLDQSINKLIENRDKYFVIATDTALSVLKKHKIKTDAVISIDGQNISYKHFIAPCDEHTLYVFDLQANYSAVNFVKAHTDNIIFIKSGHPLCNFAEQYCKISNFKSIDSGAGTVTIAAIDFAHKTGFSNFEVFGADFSYRNNKPYTKGTYLDCLYRQDETKINPAENHFSNLIYRTEISKENNIIHNEILDLYKSTFINWIETNNFTYKYDNNIYIINSGSTKSNSSCLLKAPDFDFNSFKTYLTSIRRKYLALETINHHDDFILCLLPFISFIRTKNQNLDFTSAVKLALTKILEYNS